MTILFKLCALQMMCICTQLCGAFWQASYKDPELQRCVKKGRYEILKEPQGGLQLIACIKKCVADQKCFNGSGLEQLEEPEMVQAMRKILQKREGEDSQKN